MPQHQLERGDHVADGLHGRRLDQPAEAVGAPVGGGAAQVVRERGGQVAGRTRIHRRVQRALDRRREPEVHLGDERADRLRMRRPLHAAARAQGRGVERVDACREAAHTHVGDHMWMCQNQ